MKCPQCKHEWTQTKRELASEMGKRSSKAKTAAARANGALGLLDGIRAVWRERHTPLDRFIAACRGDSLGVD